MRISLVALQPDLDRHFLELLVADAEPSDLLAHAQDVPLADVEIHVDRIELNDGGELGRAVGSDQLAFRNQPRRDVAVERRLDLGVTEIEFGLGGVGPCLLQPGLRGIAVGGGVVERRLRCDLANRKLGWRSYSASACFNVA